MSQLSSSISIWKFVLFIQGSSNLCIEDDIRFKIHFIPLPRYKRANSFALLSYRKKGRVSLLLMGNMPRYMLACII